MDTPEWFVFAIAVFVKRNIYSTNSVAQSNFIECGF